MQDAFIDHLQNNLTEQRKELAIAQDKLVYQLTMMKQRGFETVPQDEEFETFMLTDEVEADIEARRSSQGGGNTRGILSEA